MSRNEPTDVAATAGPAPAAPLGDRAARGLYWLLGQSLILKVVGLGGQIGLSWFLTREQFDLVAWSLSVATFANLIQEAGIYQILVNRQARFRQWAGPAFWLAVLLGLTAGILMS